MLIYFGLICGIVMLVFALLMLALKFSRYKGEKHGDQCGCHCKREKNCEI